MLRWNLSERAAGAWVVAASLLPLTAVTGSEPERPDLTPLEQVQQETAQQRWERLKSRYQPVVLAEPGKTSEPVAVPKAREEAVIRPIPDDDLEWTPTRLSAATPLPNGTEEPAWIIAAPHVPPASAESRPQPAATLQTVPASAAVGAETRAAPLAKDPGDTISPVAAQVQPALPPMPMPAPTAAPSADENPSVRRPVRAISEIKPFYDTAVDEDIRQYADERAADYDVHFGSHEYQPRMFADTAVAWQPTNFYHYPLYFEDAVLERYGHSYPFVVQPFVSVAKFSGQLVALPYQMTLDPVNKPMYTLGWYRPGEVAPKLKYQIPWNAQAAAVQAGVTTGLIFLIP